MNESRPVPRKDGCKPCLVLLLGLLVLAAAGFSWVVMVVQKVLSGAGMEYCCSVEGVAFNYLAVFVSLCGVLFALLFVGVLRVRDWLLRRDFERRYGVKVPKSRPDSAGCGGSGSGRSLQGVDAGDGD